MFFDAFPLIQVDPKGVGESKLVTNLLRRVNLRAKIKTNTAIFDTYDVKEGETPESIAFKMYGDSEYHWVVLLMNDITDRYHQWPVTTPQFLSFLKEKYTDPNATHHYEITQTSGDTTVKINVGSVNTDYPTATAVSNFAYEEAEQDKKRQIRLLNPAYIETLADEFKSMMKESIL